MKQAMVQQIGKRQLVRAVLSLLMIIGGAVPALAQVQVTPAMLEAKVRSYLAETTPMDAKQGKLGVEIIRLPMAPFQLKGNTVQLMAEDSRPTPMTGRTIVQVLMSTEAETRRVGIPVRLTVEKPVWVAARLIRSGEPLSARNAVLQRKQITLDAAEDCLDTRSKLGNYQSRMNLSPGTVLETSKLKAIPAVHHNEEVHLVLAMQSGVQVSVLAKSLQDGAIGQKVRVSRKLNDNREKIYTGEVIDRNTVLVRI